LFLRLFIFIAFCLLNTKANSMGSINLTVGTINGPNWKLSGVALEAENIFNLSDGRFHLSAAKLTLPKPLDGLELAELRCEKFRWHQRTADCTKGRALVKSKRWRAIKADFSFHLAESANWLKLESPQMALSAEMNGQHWQTHLKAKHLDAKFAATMLKTFAPALPITPQQGSADIDGDISGSGNNPAVVKIKAKINGLNAQSEDGKLATEKLGLMLVVAADKTTSGWQWRGNVQLNQGALYKDPLYLDATVHPLTLSARGSLNQSLRRVRVDAFDFSQSGVVDLSGQAQVRYRHQPELAQAELLLRSDNLQSLLATYIQPFFADSPLSDATASGHLEAAVSLMDNAPQKFSARFDKLNMQIPAATSQPLPISAESTPNNPPPLESPDSVRKFAITDSSGVIDWDITAVVPQTSHLQWQRLVLGGVPFDAAKLTMISQGRQLRLAEKTRLPVIGGVIDIDRFSIITRKNDEPEVAFAATLNNLSLEQLSAAKGWTPLSGNISGQIPGVRYRNKTLSLDGELLVNVFDGQVRINRLSSSGLWSDFPKVKTDIAIDNIDLDQLTRKFSFGNITGKLSGFVTNLLLESWRPVSFIAWFGTPEGDDSSHRISQKAVNNIASIGGGGATDLISRSFLGFFETFRYSEIGVGCYLHNGVCQMSGVEAAEQGYYLVKGGCLPRIDVLGYNTQVNWDVLVERLARVASPNQAIIQ
jgi:hypothetical protein